MENQIVENLKSSLTSQNTSHLQQQVMNSATAWEYLPFLQALSLTFIGLLGLTLTGSVFIMYVNKRSLRTPGNTVVLSLALSDFFRGIFLLPYYIFLIQGSTSGNLFCKCLNFLSQWINLASVLSILLIAMDRHAAIKDPFHYVKNNSKRRAGIFVTCTWILSILLPCPILFGFPELDNKSCDIKVSAAGSIFDPVLIYELAITFTAFIVPLVSVACLYYSMYRSAKINIGRNERNSCSSYGSSDVVVNMKSPRISEDSENDLRRHTYVPDNRNCRQNNRFIKKNRAAVTGLFAVVPLIVCFTPYFIIRLYQQFRMMAIGMNFWFYFPTFLATVINPYIYFYRTNSTKTLAVEMFHRKMSSMYFSTIIRNKIVSVSELYHISARRTQTVAASQSMKIGQFRHFSKTEHNLDSIQNKDDSQSSMTRKQFFHQDSSSTNSSSDLCLTATSSDSGETVHYQPHKQKYCAESSSEVKH